MSETTLDYLYLMAEVSITTVALSGITMVLAVTNLSLTEPRATMIGIQLRMAFIVTAFSLFPLLLAQYQLREPLLWLIASGAYLTSVIANLFWSSRGDMQVSKLPGRSGNLARFTGTTAVALLSVNIWITSPWPYFTQLFIGWGCSTLLFLAFIHEVLTAELSKTQKDEPQGSE